MQDTIAENLTTLKNKIGNATLIAVSKRKSADDIRAAIQAGQHDFGENNAKEFLLKYQELMPHNIKWHFIGHLQGNKAKDVVGKAALIHSVGSLKLAHRIDRLAGENQITQDCLVQVNISAEEQKSGCLPDELPSFFKSLNELSHINILGLMMIGTATEDKNLMKSEFATLRKLKEDINAKNIYKTSLTELSMGMSGSIEIALEEGATMIRIGTDIFGKRD